MTSTRRPRHLLGVLVASVALVAAWAAPAGANPLIEAQGVALSTSASCSWGDIDATYAATAVSVAALSFTAADGTVLESYSVDAYQSDFVGTEAVISETEAPPPAGTIVGVYYRVGQEPPSASTTGEFFVLYRCDDVGDYQGGTNEVLQTCFGDYGTCPQSAAEALAPATTTTSGGTTPTTAPVGPAAPGLPTASPATAVSARPTFTG